MTYDPSKSTWLNPNIEYLFDNEIIEYDIRDAGFTIIKYYRLLSPSKIKELELLEKMERHRTVGKLQGADKGFSKALMNKFAEVRSVFISANNLSDDNIISVKKDAIFTIGKCNRIKFGKIEFVPKNEYTSYIRFVNNMNIEIYYNSGIMDVKGIGNSVLNRHRFYILEFIKHVIHHLETKDVSIKRYMKKFIDDYKNMKLDEEYYLEFNNLSRDLNPLYNFQKLIIPFIHIIMKEI